tara:strand:- start:90 stop:482 length:393 start_codon:yes stop_codon:yes gene_type:complete
LKINISIFKNKLNKFESFVIHKGKFNKKKSIPIRVLSKNISRFNIFQNKEIKKNIKMLTKYKNFMLVVINNEMNKFKKNDTDVTLRYYGLGAQIIKEFNVRNMILFSRSKKKLIGLEGFGLKIKKQIIIK